MTSPRVIYFGIRTQKSAAEVGGWSKVDQMGLKDALTYDTATQKYHNYTKSQVINLIESLQKADLIVGFNQLNFDYKILSTYTDTDLEALPNFDMLNKIEQTLNFRVSRDNLAQNTLNELKNNKGRSRKNSVEITKKLFAHACKEGYLSYHNTHLGTKAICNTANWADTARNMTQRIRRLAETMAPGENDEIETNPPSITSPASKPLEVKSQRKPPAKINSNTQYKSQHDHTSAKQIYNQTTRYQDTKPASTKVTHKETEIRTNPIVRQNIESPKAKPIPEEALQIYGDAKNQQHHHPALYTYKKVENLLDPSISFQQFNVGIVGLWLDQNLHEGNDKNGSFRYYYIDGSGTIASEWVNDSVDIRNIKEELARGI